MPATLPTSAAQICAAMLTGSPLLSMPIPPGPGPGAWPRTPPACWGLTSTWGHSSERAKLYAEPCRRD
jgi:hypothetical protein